MTQFRGQPKHDAQFLDSEICRREIIATGFGVSGFNEPFENVQRHRLDTVAQ